MMEQSHFYFLTKPRQLTGHRENGPIQTIQVHMYVWPSAMFSKKAYAISSFLQMFRVWLRPLQLNLMFLGQKS